jgi:hypothetical protein
MNVPALPAICVSASVGATAVLVTSFLTISSPASESVTSVASVAGTSSGPMFATSSALGVVGDTFTAHSSDGTTYHIRLDKVAQQVTLIPYESVVNVGDHIAAAEFTITGTTGAASDNADLAPIAAGSDGGVYSATDGDITAGPSLKGQFTINPRQQQTGWVTFELPLDVTMTSVQWRPAFGSGVSTWTVERGWWRGLNHTIRAEQ